jgi:hypothetical protein
MKTLTIERSLAALVCTVLMMVSRQVALGQTHPKCSTCVAGVFTTGECNVTYDGSTGIFSCESSDDTVTDAHCQDVDCPAGPCCTGTITVPLSHRYCESIIYPDHITMECRSTEVDRATVVCQSC